MSLKSAALALAAALALTAPSVAQERPSGKPDATVSIKQFSVAFIGSAAAGGGILHYQGRSYPISVGGLGVGGLGASSIRASGQVYGLAKKSDIAGAYAQLRQGWALGDQGQWHYLVTE
jgi:hypothetical protein